MLGHFEKESPKKMPEERQEKIKKESFYTVESKEKILAKLEENRRVLEGIKLKTKQIEVKLLKESKLKHLSGSEYFYGMEEWKKIFETLSRVEESLYGLVENPMVSFSGENNITHFLGNGIQTYSRLIEFFLRKIVNVSEDGEEELKGEIKEEFSDKLEYFEKNKETWDYTLYYLDYMSDEENSWDLVNEMPDSEGYLGKEEIKKCLIEDYKNPSEDLDKLKFINFFVRLDSNWDSNLKNLKGMDKICREINEENFDEEFDRINIYKYKFHGEWNYKISPK